VAPPSGRLWQRQTSLTGQPAHLSNTHTHTHTHLARPLLRAETLSPRPPRALQERAERARRSNSKWRPFRNTMSLCGFGPSDTGRLFERSFSFTRQSRRPERTAEFPPFRIESNWELKRRQSGLHCSAPPSHFPETRQLSPEKDFR